MKKTNKISCFQGLYIRDSVKKKKKEPCSVSDGQKYGGDERKNGDGEFWSSCRGEF